MTNCPKCQSQDLQLIAFLKPDDEDIPTIKRLKCESCLKEFDIDLDTDKLASNSLLNILNGFV